MMSQGPIEFGVTERKASAFEYEFIEAGGNPAGTFEGYGSVFNNEDLGGDVMCPGAFGKSLDLHKSRGTMPKMLLNHGSMGAPPFGGNDPMADLPIGKWKAMSEDGHGLQVKGRLINLDTDRGKSIYGAMKEGELSGLSIGYRVKDFIRGTKPNEAKRQLKEVDLFEVSPVTFPMNTLAGVSTVKSSDRLSRQDGEKGSHLGLAICGYATLYDSEHFFEGRYDTFAKGCFDDGLAAGVQVGFFLDHDKAQFLGSTLDRRLEIFSNDVGLAFKFWLDASDRHQAALADVASGVRRECSVGYQALRETVVELAGRERRIIHSALLVDVSIGRKAVVRGTYATLVDPNEFGLAEDCLSGRFAARLAIRKPIDALRDSILLGAR
jgi:Escherichia/Staphylococcus phage prohead protease